MCSGSKMLSHECSSKRPALHQTRATTPESAKGICSLGFHFFHFAPKWMRWKVVGCIGVKSQWPTCKVLLLRCNTRAQRWYHSVHLPLSLKRWTLLFLCTSPLSCCCGGISIDIAPCADICHAPEKPTPGNGEPQSAVLAPLSFIMPVKKSSFRAVIRSPWECSSAGICTGTRGQPRLKRN